MIKTPLLAAAFLALCSSVAYAQTSGGVITPPSTKPDGSVITPPSADTDPGIEKIFRTRAPTRASCQKARKLRGQATRTRRRENKERIRPPLHPAREAARPASRWWKRISGTANSPAANRKSGTLGTHHS